MANLRVASLRIKSRQLIVYMPSNTLQAAQWRDKLFGQQHQHRPESVELILLGPNLAKLD